ncbi:MAG: hypothetical protein KAW12_27035, partial [Candidatus Aminicenantes bacterium]|nr:hypothetical protein [Candidatus Aminicenantes bacterium]
MKQQKDSKFITILAYIMMAFCGYLTLVSLVLSILFFFKPPLELLAPLDEYIGILQLFPPSIVAILKNHYHKISFCYLIISAVTLSASFALLKRRHWARVYVAVFFILTMVLSVVEVFFPEHYLLPVPAEDSLRPVIESMNKSVAFLVKIMAVAIVGLHSWVAYKLFSKDIKKQFQTPGEKRGQAGRPRLASGGPCR